MPAPVTKIADFRRRLTPTHPVSELELHRLKRDLEAWHASGLGDLATVESLLAQVHIRLDRPKEAIHWADAAFGRDQSHEMIAAVARLKTNPHDAATMFVSMMADTGANIVLACNLAEALARAEKWTSVPAALRNAYELVEDGDWTHAHRLAYAAAVARNIPLCALMLKRHLTWRHGDSQGAVDPYMFVVKQRERLEKTSRWFDEFSDAVDQMEHEVSDREHADSWVDGVYELMAGGLCDTALDELYDNFEAMLDSQQFASADGLLRRLDPVRLRAEGVVGVLIATLGARSALTSRENFVERARPVLDGQEEGFEALVAGLA